MSCIETYSTLRISSETLSPEEIENIISVVGTKKRSINPHSKAKHERKFNMWQWSTKNKNSSLETENHLEQITKIFVGKELEFEKLRKCCQIDIISYFVTNGQGGPSISAELMKELSLLGIDIWWDVYIDREN